MKALLALQDAHRDRKHERRRERAHREHDEGDRVDVQHVRERSRERERHDEERDRRDHGEAQRASRQTFGPRRVGRRGASRDLTRHGHLQRTCGNEHDGEETEEGCERAVILRAEDAARREKEDVGGDDRSARCDAENDAAARTAPDRRRGLCFCAGFDHADGRCTAGARTAPSMCESTS